jgi:ketosteroid isomerase-like protein
MGALAAPFQMGRGTPIAPYPPTMNRPGSLVAWVLVVASCTACREQAMRPMNDEPSMQAEAVVRGADAAWSKGDLEGMVALFTPDATLESPLVPKLLHKAEGVCHGCDDIREVVRALMQQGTPWASHDPPVARGTTVFVEYRGPDREPFSVDVLELRDGRTASLRAYLGWRALAKAAP